MTATEAPATRSTASRIPKQGRLTRAETLQRKIADEIVHGRLLPGMRLEEQALADRFQTSRTPVREALRQLAASGLIEFRPRRGVFVAVITRQQMAEMFETMAELEGTCARLAAERMTEEERGLLQALHQRGAALAEAGDGQRYAGYNLDFHSAIYRGAHNEFLHRTTLDVRNRLSPYRWAQFEVPGRVCHSHREHDVVVKALITGAAADAYEAMRGHILAVSDASAPFANAPTPKSS